MGKIIFEFKWGDDSISNVNNYGKGLAKLQYFQRKYRMDIIEQIHIPEEDCHININIQDLDQEIDWDSLPLPNEKVRQIIRSLEHYQYLSEELDRILSEIRYITYEKKYDLNRLGRQAIAIISSFRPCEHFENIHTDKSISIKDISYTLDKEVEILITYVKQRASQKRKNDALYDARRHLTNTIKRIKFGLDNIKLK